MSPARSSTRSIPLGAPRRRPLASPLVTALGWWLLAPAAGCALAQAPAEPSSTDGGPSIPTGPTDEPPPAPTSPWVLTHDLAGAALLDAFDVQAIADPTHGTVTYVDAARARSTGLLSVDPATGHARLAVESSRIATGSGRESVRIRSKDSFHEGLFVIDVHHLPEGNAVWPAFWMVGPSPWPTGGEIDIIEGVNDQPRDASTLHTTDGCSMASVDAAATMTGRYGERDCNAGDKATGMPYIGCSTTGAHGSFGPALNAGGGGVFALRWTAEAIDVWFWPRVAIPPDVTTGSGASAQPDPSSWGLPMSHFELGAACDPAHFAPQRMVLNTTLCGDWAGAVFVGPNGQTGYAACRDYVLNNPTAFARAYWDIASLRAYTFQP